MALHLLVSLKQVSSTVICFVANVAMDNISLFMRVFASIIYEYVMLIVYHVLM